MPCHSWVDLFNRKLSPPLASPCVNPTITALSPFSFRGVFRAKTYWKSSWQDERSCSLGHTARPTYYWIREKYLNRTCIMITYVFVLSSVAFGQTRDLARLGEEVLFYEYIVRAVNRRMGGWNTLSISNLCFLLDKVLIESRAIYIPAIGGPPRLCFSSLTTNWLIPSICT